MTRAERDLRAGAILKSRAYILREIARQVKRLGLPNAPETTRQARLEIVADLAKMGSVLYKVAADLIDKSDESPEVLKAKQILAVSAKRVLPWP